MVHGWLTSVQLHVVRGVDAAADGAALEDLGPDLMGSQHVAVLADRQAVVVQHGLAAGRAGPAGEALLPGVALRARGGGR